MNCFNEKSWPVAAFPGRAQPLRRDELPAVPTGAPLLIAVAAVLLLVADFSWKLAGVELLLVPALVLLARRRIRGRLAAREKAAKFAERAYAPAGSGRSGAAIRHCSGCTRVLVRDKDTDSPADYSSPTDADGWAAWARRSGAELAPAPRPAGPGSGPEKP
ncbi:MULTISPECIES: hypothetical protein [Streptomyces]|uniref:Integral membrane protein n=1 Tax=Streptomyces mutomycini TaxID=284036 RepID=A0ABW0B3Y4_9ACTN|nr:MULTISPECIES: hypothetical protein [Streptomyces]KPC81747.1 hypothetical protein ADK82_15025 [Streptomyces sp. NRRL S-4]